MENEKAFPSKIEKKNADGRPYLERDSGMDLKDYFIAHVEDDFLSLPLGSQEAVVGRSAPIKRLDKSSVCVDYNTLEYAQWVAEGSAKWKIMKVNELMKARR